MSKISKTKKKRKAPSSIPRPIVIDIVRAKPMASRGVDRNGDHYWRAIAYEDGQQSTVWTGRGSREKVRQSILEVVADGAQHPRQRARNETLLTIGEILRAWLYSKQSDPSLRPATKKMYASHSKRVDAVLGKVSVGRVLLATLESYRNRRRREGAKYGTLQNEFLVLRSGWEWARLNEYIPNRVLPRVRVERLKEGDERQSYTPTENEFWAVHDQLPKQWMRTAVLILRATGARLREGWNLTVEELDAGPSTVTLNGKRGMRTILVDRSLFDHLEAVLPAGATGKVMEAMGVTWAAYRDLRTRLAPVCKRVGVQRFTPQGIRRLAVDEVYRAGIDVGVAAAWAGHSPTIALAHYRRATLEDQQRLIDLAAPGRRPDDKGKVLLLAAKISSAG